EDKVTLRNRFPILFNMSLQKEATIREMRDNQGWDLRFRRHLNDWEVNRIVELLNILGQCKDLNTNEDNLFWNPDKWMALEDDLESQDTIQDGMFHLAVSQSGCTHSTQPHEKRDCEVVADFHQLKGHQLDYAKDHQRSSSLLEQRWESVRTQEERCFKNKSCSMQNLKLNCLVLFFFWCKHEYPQDAEDIP
ncbi:hypothetical protein H5410_055428, partial [Solanum commersonii]